MFSYTPGKNSIKWLITKVSILSLYKLQEIAGVRSSIVLLTYPAPGCYVYYVYRASRPIKLHAHTYLHTPTHTHEPPHIHTHSQSGAAFQCICVFINVFINTLTNMYLNIVFYYFLVYLNALNGVKQTPSLRCKGLPVTRQLMYCAQDKY